MNKKFYTGWRQPGVRTSWLTVIALVLFSIVTFAIILTIYMNLPLQLNFEPLGAFVEEASAMELPEPEELEAVTGETPESIIRELGGVHTEYLLKLAMCESSMRPDVRGEVDSRDRGLFQINSRWNPDVTDECAFDVRCATEWTIGELEANRAWKWVCNDKI